MKKLPQEVQNILNSFDFDNDAYQECARIVQQLKEIGYESNYGLDGEINVESIKKITFNKNILRVVEIETTAFEEENFSIITDLSDEEIIQVIDPIVMLEREDEEHEYDNESLVNALIMCYPHNFVRLVEQPVNKIVI